MYRLIKASEMDQEALKLRLQALDRNTRPIIVPTRP